MGFLSYLGLGNDSDEEENGFACSECGEEFDTETGRNIHSGQVH